MSKYSDYPLVTSTDPTDLFLLSRDPHAPGDTKAIQAQNLGGGGGTAAQIFRASLRSTNVDYTVSAIKIMPYDHIDYDTTGGFSLTQVIPIIGTHPAFKVPADGYYCFTTATQFSDPTTTEDIQMLISINHYFSDGSDLEFYQFNSLLQSVSSSPPSSRTFSVGHTVTAFCNAGDFINVNNDLESASTSPTLIANTGSASLPVTFFSGYFIGS